MPSVDERFGRLNRRLATIINIMRVREEDARRDANHGRVDERREEAADRLEQLVDELEEIVRGVSPAASIPRSERDTALRLASREMFGTENYGEVLLDPRVRNGFENAVAAVLAMRSQG